MKSNKVQRKKSSVLWSFGTSDEFQSGTLMVRLPQRVFCKRDFKSQEDLDPQQGPQKHLKDISRQWCIVCKMINLLLNRRHFIVLWRRRQWFYTDFSCWMRTLGVFHVYLFRFNPADLDGQELAVIFPGSTIGGGSTSGMSSGTGGCWGRLRPSSCGIRSLDFILHPVDLDKIFIGRQLACAWAWVVLRDRVLTTADCLFIGRYGIPPGLFLGPADIYTNYEWNFGIWGQISILDSCVNLSMLSSIFPVSVYSESFADICLALVCERF